MNKEYIIRGNSAILKCQIPSFVADFVSVISWHTDQEENFYPDTKYGSLIYQQSYVIDFKYLKLLSIISKLALINFSFLVVTQHYENSVNVEYVIRGNAAVLKCQIPSFVSDFVSVVSWHTDQDEVFYPDSKYG